MVFGDSFTQDQSLLAISIFESHESLYSMASCFSTQTIIGQCQRELLNLRQRRDLGEVFISAPLASTFFLQSVPMPSPICRCLPCLPVLLKPIPFQKKEQINSFSVRCKLLISPGKQPLLREFSVFKRARNENVSWQNFYNQWAVGQLRYIFTWETFLWLWRASYTL